MSEARKSLDWERMLDLSIDPQHARELRQSSLPHDSSLCTMCGEYCAMKKVKGVLGKQD
jgi:phosphomethylpyrimidine synthase